MGPGILIYAPQLVNISETFIYDQIVNIKGFDVSLFCNSRLNKSIFPFLNEPVVLGDKPKNLSDRILSKLHRILQREGQFSLSYSATKKLQSYIYEGKIGLIHCHYGVSAISLMPLIKKKNIPLLISFHGYDASRLLRLPKYVSQLRVLFDLNVFTITPSVDMMERLIEFGLNPVRNRVIRYGIDINYFRATNDYLKSGVGVVNILHSGRITPKKGVFDLLKVIDELREMPIHFHIVGDGGMHNKAEYDAIREYINIREMNTLVSLHGAQPRERVKGYMQAADIFVLNSRTSDDGDMEGSPVSIMEAMSSGMAVISTVHSGIPETVVNGVNGLLVPEMDNASLREAIYTLIVNPDLRRTLSLKAMEDARNYFSNDIVIEKIEKFYAEILTANVSKN